MECRAYCTAASYQLKPLYDRFSTRSKTTFYRDVVHASIPLGNESANIFFFSYGLVIFWSLNEGECKAYLELIKEFEVQPLEDIETDEFTFTTGNTPKIVEDEIILPNFDSLSFLAVSYGIAQSVKLSAFENAVRKSYDNTKHIPEQLAKFGHIPLSRRQIRCKMGQLFLDRNSVNLHVDVLETPEFFWEYSELEPLYIMTANYLELQPRVEILNHRLGVVHELFEMLGNELNHQHSSRLEWTIIILIVIEILLALHRDIFSGL